ncbi:MAG: branched-chain amino acid ABC transporter permease [Rhodospirillaceae bacterium]|nr:branched-chain amino acid ABC transporter permease [Rhodospirillaceae bacterium]MBT6883843.1 branched-chain amino acid ABC transporter permease [Rhodospirillaceae bacterium]MBT7248523.1 branched-chain amino acid ABC transporter permease [Rhodospirillaceae bacterium]
MDWLFLLIQTLNGIQYGLLLFLIASGLTLVFGIMGIINLAHGSFYMIGAYLAFSFTQMTGNLFTAILLGIPVTLVLGYGVERVFMIHLYKRDHLHQVLLTFGLILIFNELQLMIWGGDPNGVPIPDVLSGSLPISDTLSYPVYRIFLSVVCLVLAGSMALVIRHTRVGMRVRAGAANRAMAESLGVNMRSLSAIVFSVGVTLAGVAGMLAAPVETVYPGMGEQILIISFVVVVIGGIGSIKGAFVGALAIGLVDVYGQVYLPEIASVAVYGLMAAVLLWRPSGLFGRT